MSWRRAAGESIGGQSRGGFARRDGDGVFEPGAVFADLAAAVADGVDCIDGIGQLCGDREHVFGAKASTTTMWRLEYELSFANDTLTAVS